MKIDTKKTRKTAGTVSRRKFLAGTGVAVAAPAILTSGLARAEEELNILVWCDHADPKLITPFEEANNVRVNVKSYEGTGTALTMIEQSAPGDWDIFVVDAQDVPRVGRTGILAEIPDADVPWDDIFPELRAAPFTYVDGKLYAVPEKFGYYGVAYNKDRVDPADMRNANVFWNEKYKGRMAVYDYYFPCMQLIGIALGITPDEINSENLGQIREKLLAFKPQLKLVGDIVGVQNALVNGDVDLIVNAAEFAVSGLMTEDPALDWVIFDQGGLLWDQGLAIMADSQKKDLAKSFVDYITSPAGQGRLATSDCYWAMPANMKADLTDAQKKILRWDEQTSFLERSYPSSISDPELDAEMLDVWTEFLQA